MAFLSSAKAQLPRTVGWLLRVIGLAAVYYLAARLGLRYASIGQSISLVWPPTGIAIAALIVLGPSTWPGVALGAFLANAATAIPPSAAAAIAVGNTLEAVLAAALLARAVGRPPRLDAMPAVRVLVLASAPLGATVSALIGVTALVMSGVLPSAGADSAIAVWWTGNLLGALVIAPLLLAWAPLPRSTASARGPLEVALLCLGTVLAAELGLGHLLPVPAMFRRLDYLYVLFPFVIWAALRFGSRGASLMTFTVSLVAVWRTIQGGGPFNTTTGGGTLFAVACYLGVVAVTGLLLAAAVTHERESATEALRRRDEQLRVALDAARMGVWFWSSTDNRLTWDDTLRRMYGVTPDHPISGYDDFISRVHPDDRDLVGNTVRRALADGGRLDYEFRIVLPDGRVRWIADQGRVVPGDNGAPVGMTGACMDVTDRRTAEEHLRLAHRMESVGRLAGGVAHEANNQMSVVIGAAHYILARPDIPAAVRTDAEFIRQAAERTAAVTAQLLAFSRRQVLRPQVLDVNGVLEKFRPVLQRTMGEDCSVTLRLAPALGHVKADPGQLEQVLLNLAINARDAMPRGGALAIETSSVDLTEGHAAVEHGVAVRPGAYVLLAVSDTGHGMDRATLDHAFEPFFTTKGVGQGTGLGLATVYGVVKQSEGYVWAYSDPGKGTTMKIYLPVTDAVPDAAVESPVAPERTTGELVMVVEDDAPVRSIAARALAEEGYRVMEAGSGAEAVELLRRSQERPALVLTDVVMPGMSGSELAAAVARLSPGTPVLFTSGYTDSEILRRGLLEPGADFLPKPFSPDALVRAVRLRTAASGSG
ncbi:MAG TPA: MASE1 domain-containing protein [Gemmatimonadales bacterium]|nr:MASE1 domain-containing protein [Gemmatimonadales bacterium]